MMPDASSAAMSSAARTAARRCSAMPIPRNAAAGRDGVRAVMPRVRLHHAALQRPALAHHEPEQGLLDRNDQYEHDQRERGRHRGAALDLAYGLDRDADTQPPSAAAQTAAAATDSALP
jgi:hypothetical protein